MPIVYLQATSAAADLFSFGCSDLTRPWRPSPVQNLDGGVQGSPAKPDLHGEITNSPCKLVYMVEKAAKITI